MMLALLLFAAAGAQRAAGPGTSLTPITVTGTRIAAPGFDVPAAIGVVNYNEIVRGPPSVSLAQSLARVPGVIARNRQSYAQDLQISIRGFGARASFGVRGIRLLVDGIPVSTPAGQGETDIFDLASAKRIEVLRGPFSALYGNASGGVIQILTRNGPPQPTVTAKTMVGSYGMRLDRLEGGGTAGDFNYIADLSHFYTGGWRDHSAAKRDHLRAKLRYALGTGSSLNLLFNGENQPFAEDPSGLTAAQAAENPRQAVPQVYQYHAGESHRHRQGGLVWKQRLGAHDRLHVMGFLGSRRVIQFLPFEGASPTGGGAVVDLDNNFGGGDTRWIHGFALAGAPLDFIAGADYQRLHERRKGFVNDSGTEGALRRNEDDFSTESGQYVQAEWHLDRWNLFAGIRHSRVSFESDDHYATSLDPNDSGSRDFASTDPVAGVLYKITPHVNIYANYGRGFETPTLAELAYRPDGRAGFNFTLDPSTSENYEAGLKGDWQPVRFRFTLFKTTTDDEIVVGQSVNGRTSYRNAGSTRRRGVELSLQGRLGGGFGAYFSYSYLHARFAGGPFDGERLPGVPRESAYAELDWRYRPLGFTTSLDAQWRDRVYVDSQNSSFAGSYVTFDYQLGFKQNIGDWQFDEYARVNNLLDRRYIGAVIVNAGNGRFFEPAPGRNFTFGASIGYAFY